MSESDDSDILADIQALDEALALKTNTNSQEYVCSGHRSDVSSDVDLEGNDLEVDYSEYLGNNQHIDESLNAYEINLKLIMGLTIAKRKLTAMLEECEQKIKLLDERTNSRELSSYSKLALSNAGIPYFKDKDNFSAPKNYDTKLKEARGELCPLSVKKPNRWSSKDRDKLLEAIHDQLTESNEKEADEPNDPAKKMKFELPINFDEKVGALGEREFDWYKISVMTFINKHSPGECRSMWNIYLHPDFRKSEWTSMEDKKLVRCVREYRFQNWDAITEKLGTNRSAYQCFIRYNTIKKVPLAGRAWTRQEDKHLLKIMNAVKVGDYIPWSEVANHLRHRTKQQIYVRWMYRKAPHLRKGRFTYTETITLLQAVQKYGENFCKISSNIMPNRTSIQLQERYNTVMLNMNSNNWNLWSLNDDVTLINLHLKFNNNWSKIAKYFSNKTRTQVRHRYNALLKYVMKGVSIENIPRPPATMRNRRYIRNKKLSKGAEKVHNKIKLHEMEHTVNILDIELRLYENLCFPPLVKPNNSEEEPYDIEELARDTRRLYSTLNLLNANLDIPSDFLKYVQLNDKEKELLVSLKEHMNVRSVGVRNDEITENYRTRMFGYASEVSQGDFFIPPLPFDGYVRVKKIQQKRNDTSIDYDLDVSKKFLVDVPADFHVTACTLHFVSSDEEMQFRKFGQFLISDYRDYYQQNVNLYKSLKCISSCARRSPSNKASSKRDKLDTSSKITVKDYEQTELNKLRETSVGNNVKEENEEAMDNIIRPNQATLLGLKNLFLWKLLYDCQYESHARCKLIASFERNSRSKQAVTNSRRPVQTESAEYQLLRTRLLQLFKLPIGLSRTTLYVQGPDQIFVQKEKPRKVILSTISRKRQFKNCADYEDMTHLKRSKKDDSNVSVNNDSQPTSDPTTENLPRARSCRVTRKKNKTAK
ncbi:PREDICTED: uncharacterized protein LOC105451092 [Wasmannia auropunctata]|uniref:uncharacterized protein LOC105451092 n=1 Tax=Wasmannia auropunctata TaxID=64793 RepID=UPI0005EE3CC0|nr:PREDICTED: uncharacterized protein LOC105451092 [Wasmannia auropunctata]XP_011689647.1 PREDICTED: uncharacterized protein LOC105451092 [Wasmannia auropunctata]XP_011689656.1 PREDICTED: uncharacterized protein LOC105451092 [Wasmannia auropunctata]XP_011689664.1 PREDICTED: uncharacterized protein LOC105451092 [Wasmannia auropunctata]XP_011689672.1 PREDICTED: uncharacterized protein LOC105451092 [Wasmannia auropunctata]XP_011689679.1 PREDICTED: uncharacterized protein LOC105451092 [Wasmannia a